MIVFLHFSTGVRENLFMRQGSLFSRAETAAMRDRTAARNYSAERDEFRREHERRRSWGLRRRHAEKLHRLREGGSVSAPQPADSVTQPPPEPTSRRATHREDFISTSRSVSAPQPA